ncbi:MAG TPA: glycosyltransferase family 39 protein [Kofleriaceae bacterium]|nr:glycosyltransferase family 39 protein [Kofleriaceae bacterium]
MGSIAIAFVYLLVHAREPLRLNIGDPWSDANVLTSINYVKSDGFLATSFTDILDVGPLTKDSYRYIHYPPLSEIIYGAVGKYLGASDIGTFRLFGLAFSTLAMWLLFCYVRRLYSERVGLIATALFATSLLWLMYADSMHQAPVMQLTGFLALWGLVRVIETGQRRHHAALVIGSFACFFTSYDYYLFLPTAVLATIYIKSGNPFARGNRHLVALSALGCLLGIVAKCLCTIGAVGWTEFVADLHLQFFERATSAHDRQFTSAIPTMIRRITLVFTPLAWIPAAFHVVKAIRSRTVASAIKDTAAWMLVPALAFLYMFAQLAASQMLASQVLLPFYAIGSALVIDRLLAGTQLTRRLAYGWLVAAPLWGFYFMFTHPRSVLDRGDVAKARAYLAANDHNDFVLSNVMSDGHVQAAFDRHSLGALDASDPESAPRDMMRIFSLTGADYAHTVVLTDPDSRFIDKSLWPLAAHRRLWSVTGAPHMHRAKANALIREYDGRVMKNLEAVGATQVLRLRNFAIYRTERAKVMQLLAETVPGAHHIDFTSMVSLRHELLGWEPPSVASDGEAASTISGMTRCPLVRCKTVLTKIGILLPETKAVSRGELMIRVERACDLQLTVAFAGPSYARISLGEFSTAPRIGNSLTFTVPARYVTPGVNVVALEDMLPRFTGLQPRVASLDFACAP